MTLDQMDDEPDSRRRVLVVVGTRPEAIKMFPVIHALRASQNVYPYVITTGQHTDLADDVFTMAGIVPGCATDESNGGPGTINELCSQVMADARRAHRATCSRTTRYESAPHTIATMVHGDTTLGDWLPVSRPLRPGFP